MRREKRRGMAIVETALMAPWIFFLFVGVLDMGFFCYAAICTQNAARAVAMAGASPISTTTACTAALGELNGLPNMDGAVNGATCNAYKSGISAAVPYSACSATITATTSSDVNCSSATLCADCGLNPASSSIIGVVTYQSLPMVPIPGLLTGQITLTRTAEVRVIQ